MTSKVTDLSIDEIVSNLWCVVDTVTGLTHIGVLFNDGDNTTITLRSPRGVFEGDNGQVVLTMPMHIGSPDGVFKLNCNTMNVQFSPCIELVDAYIGTLFDDDESHELEIYTVDAVQ